MGTIYYRNKLLPQEQTAYDAIVQGIREYQTDIRLGALSHDSIMHVYKAVRLDRPELFFLGDHVRSYHSVLFSGIRIDYAYSRPEAIKMLSQIKHQADRLAARCSTMPVYERAMHLHDCLVSSVTYSDQINSRGEAHSVVGPFILHQAVCEGIAKTYKLLCDHAKIPCIVVTGVGVDENGHSEGHAWNIVKIGNDYFHVDVTFDHFIDNQYYSRKYLFLSTEEAMTNHTPDSDFPLPHCPKSRLPLPRAKDADEMIELIRQDEKRNLTHSEYALVCYVEPHAFTDELSKKLMRTHSLLYNRIGGFFYSQRNSVNVIGIKWR